MAKKKHSKRMTVGIILLIVLAILLTGTTFAIVYSIVSVDNHMFEAGYVQLDLNGGQPVIRMEEFTFEPGATVEKEFYLENLSTWDVYYKIYFDNIEGRLAEALETKITYGEKVLYEGQASELTRDRVLAADDILAIGEKRYLKISFYFPKSSGNDLQDRTFDFDICADATQTKNNPERLFY
jgi:hypothetical protein